MRKYFKDKIPTGSVVMIILFVVSIVSMGFSFIIEDGPGRILKQHKQYLENCKENLSIAKYKISKDSSKVAEIDSLTKGVKDKSALVIIDEYKSEFVDRILENKNRIKSIRQSMEDNFNIIAIKKEEVKKFEEFRSFVLHYITTTCFVLFFVFYIDYGYIYERYNTRAKRNPKEIFLRPLKNGKFQLVYKRGFSKVYGDKKFDNEEDAIHYVRKVRDEMLEENWHKI